MSPTKPPPPPAPTLRLGPRALHRALPCTCWPGPPGKEQEFKDQVAEEAKDLAASPFGATLLHAIGYVYEEQAQTRLSLKDGGKMFKEYQVMWGQRGLRGGGGGYEGYEGEG